MCNCAAIHFNITAATSRRRRAMRTLRASPYSTAANRDTERSTFPQNHKSRRVISGFLLSMLQPAAPLPRTIPLRRARTPDHHYLQLLGRHQMPIEERLHLILGGHHGTNDFKPMHNGPTNQ